MTLIETLAVIVILSMVTGGLGLSLAGNRRSAEARWALAQWRDLDAQARVAAQIEGAIRLELDEEGHGIKLRAIRSGEVLSEPRWPDHLKGSMATAESQSVASIVFDARGRSVDYSMTLRHVEPAADSISLTTQVCGLTGWFTQEGRP